MRPAENFAADIPPELVEADDILTKYGRWATVGGGNSVPGTLDRMYIREADSKESLEAWIRRRQHVPPPPLMPVLQALQVQRALHSVPDRERIVLTILYVPNRLPIGAQLRLLRIPPKLCRDRHIGGLRMFNLRYAVAALPSRMPCL